MALLQLPLHVFTYFLHRHMSGPFDKGLYILLPGMLYQFTHRIKFGKLCSVVGIVDTPRTQSVTQ